LIQRKSKTDNLSSRNMLQGIFRVFSRRHFPKEYVTYCGMDYETDRFWTYQFYDLEMLPKAK
jgi:hypothetical protein